MKEEEEKICVPGDIVVRTANPHGDHVVGRMYEVVQSHHKNKPYKGAIYSKSQAMHSSAWRHATEAEKRAFNNGAIHIKFVEGVPTNTYSIF